ncbi:MAG: hypothetical protein ACYC5S_01125 [Thiobacillus sp.]
MGNGVNKSNPKTNTVAVKLLIGILALSLAACGRADTPDFKIPDEILKWPYKDTQHFITVRVPGGYRFMGGAAMRAVLGPAYPDPDKQRGFSNHFVVETLWPDFPPRTPRNLAEFDVPGGGRGLMISVRATYVYETKQQEEFMLMNEQTENFEGSRFASREERRLEWDFHHAKFSYTLGRGGMAALEPLPGRFGLDRIGFNADNHPGHEASMSRTPDDYYSLRNKQGRLLTFIRCGSELLRDHEDDPTSIYSPGCDQHFFFAPLNANVEVNYRRKYLSEWRDIQAKTEQLLQSFIQHQ